ncbi:MAG: tRNA (N(6)-L-threonylcarbamoyladenosine(37)-C(2))-methylthiotransferase MtaB [Chitinophagales bacterium]|nr:tRNA (N(6)-L-threonylcarbamoyladenosine(37)-C(2))-methylthiotransferase MtaB [Chitinophagales bacterium]
MSVHKKIAFHTLGCKLNFAETSAISRLICADGFEKVDFEGKADIYIINTCSVTENADKECRAVVRKALRYSPRAQIVILGCYAQLKPLEIAEIPGVDLVLGAREKFNIGEYLRKLPEEKIINSKAAVYSCDIDEVNLFESSYSFGERTRAFLKVQDGCNYNCTYCTIPLARGKSRSDTIAHVTEQSQMIAQSGVKEIVLSGVNLGDFGIHDAVSRHHEETFYELLQKLENVEAISRFRISSIEPNLLKDEIIEFVARSTRIMPHFHIPLQSGSDEILKQMKRRYLTGLYKDRIEKIKYLMPHSCVGADVIVGFPGELEKNFEETYQLLVDLDINYLHVFTYSERDHTEGAAMEKVVPKSIRNQRNKMLRILSEEKKQAFYRQHIGTTRKVLFEGGENHYTASGYTDNYIRVTAEGYPGIVGSIEAVTLENESANSLRGRLISKSITNYEFILS